MIEREDLNCATIAKHAFIKQFWSKFHSLIPYVTNLTNNERQTLFTILTRYANRLHKYRAQLIHCCRGSFPKEQYISWILDEMNNTEEMLSIFPSANDMYTALDMRFAFFFFLPFWKKKKVINFDQQY